MAKIRARGDEGEISILQISVLLVSLILFSASIAYFAENYDVNGIYHWVAFPTGSIDCIDENSTSVKIVFGTFSPDFELMDINIIITNNSDYSDDIVFWYLGTPDTDTVIMQSTEAITGTYTDLNYQDNCVNAGDYLTIDGLRPNTVYTVTIYHVPTDSMCSLSGDSTFTLEDG